MHESPQRGIRPLRDLPLIGWVAATGVVALIPSPFLAPRWLMIHLLLLGAVTHALLVWSRFVADAHNDRPPPARELRAQSARLGLFNLAVLAVAVGVAAGLWPVIAAGAAGVVFAVLWHGISLGLQVRRTREATSGAAMSRAATRYHVVACCLLPIGVALGVRLAGDLPGQLHPQAMTAHVTANVLGWLALAVLGSAVALWPTMLRIRRTRAVARAARWALPVLVAAVLTATAGAVAGALLVVTVGLVGYLAALLLVTGALWLSAHGRPPASYPAWSVLAGLVWLVVVVVSLVVETISGTSWAGVHSRLEWAAVPLVLGFGAQVLTGSLSSWLPGMLGREPDQVRAASVVLDRLLALRIVLVNGGLMLAILPVPGAVRPLGEAIMLVGLASFVPLLLLAIYRVRTIREDRHPRSPHIVGQVMAGLATLALAFAAGVGWQPLPGMGVGGVLVAASATDVQPSGETTYATVTMADMAYTPATIEVPAGDRLVIELRNDDEQIVHDLVLETGKRSGLLSPGESTRMDLGVIGSDVHGWCSVPGHRQMGMELDIEVTGGSHVSASGHHRDLGTSRSSGATGHGAGSAADDLNFLAAPPPDFKPYDAELPPLSQDKVRRYTFNISEVEQQVAPGVTQQRWTFNGTGPGPVLHGQVGDIFEIKLVNDGTHAHGIDFHAGLNAPDGVMRPIPPGESLVYRFTAARAGIWMYHCSAMPMSTHIANGMFGAVVIEPADLPKVDRSYVLVQSELYLGQQGGSANVDKVSSEEADAVVFNGYANQYDHRPLPAQLGERVRVWVLDAGPNRVSSFHVVGTQFDTVYSEGAYLLDGGSGGAQLLPLLPSQGGFVEMTFPEPGHYPIVSHLMVDAERGAHGLFEVTR
ncbi:MAG: multicopper oxidase domain-containing protein [Nocardioidaceae bacterium]